MSSKASGEPSMMLSVSVLYALRRAVAAARNGLSDSHPTAILPSATPTLQSPQADAKAESSGAIVAAQNSSTAVHQRAYQQADASCTSHIISGDCVGKEEDQEHAGQDKDRCKGNSFLVLEAPVTTAHLKEAIGQFDIAEMVRVAAGKASVSHRDPEYHSSGEWVFVH